MLGLAAKKKISITSALFGVLILFCAVACGFCCSASVDAPELPVNSITEGSTDKPEKPITPSNESGVDASGLPINLNEYVNDNDIPELEINFYSLEDSNGEENYRQNPANTGTEKDQNKSCASASPN